MNTERVSWLKQAAATVALLAVAYAVVVYAGAYARSAEPSNFRSFSVTAEGRAIGVPDVAKFTFSVVTEGGTDLAALQAQNTEKVNAAIAYLKSKSIDAKDIKTSQYSVSPRYQYYDCSRLYGGATPCPPPEIVGYTVTQSVSVKVRDFTIAGDVLSGVVASGANSVSELQFAVDDPTALQDAAREEAIGKARVRAYAVASAGGFSVGRLLGIEESGSRPVYPMYMESAAYGKGGGPDTAPSPAIEPGSEDVTVAVTLRYEIR